MKIITWLKWEQKDDTPDTFPWEETGHKAIKWLTVYQKKQNKTQSCEFLNLQV